jgi:hypothetical protein
MRLPVNPLIAATGVSVRRRVALNSQNLQISISPLAAISPPKLWGGIRQTRGASTRGKSQTPLASQLRRSSFSIASIIISHLPSINAISGSFPQIKAAGRCDFEPN